ncbi:MAG: Uma2 family endonuclease [Hydrogenobacter thermophilus]|uniref:Uma2 family endonuclease n=1 Tax=Hydrogenobacter thermophilus TaxID=940 RepID=UPI001C77826F|nr:Uma2 family endonuclease [Hydrogenobacter thermophilus]QWK19244.1 MAG: Uma2 family endonuclease [Hydrogenobacter thermophilus]
MKALLEKKKYTAQDYEKLPEGSPYQLIEGELIMSPAPAPEHQEVSINLSYRLYNVVKKTGKGKVLYAPIDVHLDEENVYQPDIVVILKDGKAKLTERGVEGPPDMVIEILSPSTAYYDLTEKKEVYERVGVKEYWIVDPKRKAIEVYNNNTEKGFELYSKAKGSGKVKSLVIPEFEVDLKEVFEEVD